MKFEYEKNMGIICRSFSSNYIKKRTFLKILQHETSLGPVAAQQSFPLPVDPPGPPSLLSLSSASSPPPPLVQSSHGSG